MRQKIAVSLTRRLLFTLPLISLNIQPVFAIDWNWPNNQIPSDQKAIDSAYKAYQDGDADTAIVLLNGVKGAANSDCRVRHILSEIYLERKRYQEAKRELQDLYQAEINLEKANTAKIGWVNPAGIRYEYANVCAEEGNYPEAINVYRELQQGNQSWLQPRFGIAKSYELMGDHEQARNAYKSILDSGIAISYADRGAIESRMSEMNKAIDARLQGNANPQTAQIPNAQQMGGQPVNMAPMGGGSVLTSQMPGSPGSSFGSHTPLGSSMGGRSVSIKPASAGTTLKAGPLEDAASDIRNRKYESAITRCKDFLTRQPKDGQAHYLLGIAYASTRQFDLARNAYEKTIEYGDISLQKLATMGLSKLPKGTN